MVAPWKYDIRSKRNAHSLKYPLYFFVKIGATVKLLQSFNISQRVCIESLSNALVGGLSVRCSGAAPEARFRCGTKQQTAFRSFLLSFAYLCNGRNRF